jgi:hypothetical protein
MDVKNKIKDLKAVMDPIVEQKVEMIIAGAMYGYFILFMLISQSSSS